MRSLLPEEDYTVFYSYNKKEGIEIASLYSPDIIVFILSNEEEDIKCIHQLINGEKTLLIPLIIVTINPSFMQQRKMMELGIDDYIPADFLTVTLEKTLKSRIKKISNLYIELNKKINSFDETSYSPKRKEHLLITVGNKLRLIRFVDILAVVALKEYSQIFIREGCKIVVRKSLNNWINILPPNNFLRIHRSTIINTDEIEKINKLNERTYSVQIKNIKESFNFSYRYASIMRKTFSA